MLDWSRFIFFMQNLVKTLSVLSKSLAKIRYLYQTDNKKWQEDDSL